MYNRQEEVIIIQPELQEQIDLPIVQLMVTLKQGKTQKIAIKTSEGFFLSAVNGGGGFITGNATQIGPNETFLLIPQGVDRNKVAISTANRNYITAIDGGGGRVDASSTTIGLNEQFIMVPQRPDQANFITSKGFFLLTLTNEPKFLTAFGLALGPRTVFTIIPQA